MKDDIIDDLIAYNYVRTGRISLSYDQSEEHSDSCYQDDCNDDCDCDCGGSVQYDSSSSRSGSGGGCFIATAAYGSYAEPHVMILREFRDNVLQHSIPGRLFIRCYYRTSPPIARLIASREFLKKIVRTILKPIVCFVNPADARKRQ